MTLSLNSVSDAYFARLFLETKAPGGKARALLLDADTTAVISMCYSQSQLLEHDVILVDLVHNSADLDLMHHLDCIVYVSPSSFDSLCREIRAPHFNKYHVFANNCLSKPHLEQLAEADEMEVVETVVELFQDYSAVNDNLFVVNSLNESRRNHILKESTSLVSLLLSLKKCPIIKYELGSQDLKRLASELLYHINSNSNNNLFDDVNQHCDRPPVLVLLDRNNDPITPLLAPWTYQSMVHESIGIHNKLAKASLALEAQVLSDTQDQFWRESMYLNYGDVTDKFQKYVQDYKNKTKQSSIDNLKTQNLAELKKTLTQFPEHKKLSANILKHLNLLSDLDKAIAAQNLWELGELQQSIVCDLESQNVLRNRVLTTLDMPHVLTTSKLILALLYAAKFPTAPELLLFAAKLNDPALVSPVLTSSQNKLLAGFVEMFGHAQLPKGAAAHKLGDLLNRKKISINSLFSGGNASGAMRSRPKTDNVYMQYVPRLGLVLDRLVDEPRDSDAQDNLLQLTALVPDVVALQYGSLCALDPVQDVIVYFHGGVTHEEGRLAHEVSAHNSHVHIIVGSDAILNTSTWLDRLYDMANSVDSADKDTGDAVASRQQQLREIL